jgi:hypothetical protein
MSMIDRTRRGTEPAWFKSTRSDDGGGCVEVAEVDGGVGVRDSKDPDGPTLWFTREEWTAFIVGVYRGEFDHVCPHA